MNPAQEAAREAACRALRRAITHRQACLRYYDDALNMPSSVEVELAALTISIVQELRNKEMRCLAKDRARLLELSVTETTIRQN